MTVFTFLIILLGAGGSHAGDDAAKTAPEDAVSRLEAALIENMRGGHSMDYRARYERLRPLVEEIMAVERMGRFLFGRDWAAFEPAQREAFKQAFLDLSAATYAGQFREFGGERFDPVEVQAQGEDRAAVKRRLTTGSGRQIAFDYLMLHSDEGWQIVTIITDGVSDLAVKRSQYQRILDSDGFDAIIARIRDSIEKQRSD